MNKQSNKISKHLSNSILLKESGSPVLLRIVLMFFILIISFFIYWASVLKLNQVIITGGEVLTKDDIAQIQHPQGGIINSILVKDGQLVDVGDTLLTFNNDVVSLQILEVKAQISTLNRRILLLKEELDIKKNLLDQELISRTSYLIFERNYNESIGERTQAYYKLESLRYLNSNINIVSPIYGYVHTLKNYASGSIIRSGEIIFEIIPYNREYIAELQLAAKDRGKITIGQKTELKFTSYDYAKYGGLETVIKSISVKTFSDSYNRPFYKVYVDLPKSYIGDDDSELTILPGMTLTGEINIGSKSLLEYLIIPIKIARTNSFNEP